MSKGIFVTATGTDVGKTYVCGLLVKKIRDFGINCGYYKPVLSGLERIDGELIPGDAKHVLKTAGIVSDPMNSVSYAFEPAVSPHLASRMANRPISVEKIKSDFSNKSKIHDYLVVEGAGGITCPFSMDGKRLLLDDIINALDMDVLVVSPAGLGSINYALLTVEYAKQKGINVRGIILNGYEKDNFMHIDNKKCIEELTGVPVVAVVEQNAKELDIEKDVLLNLFKEIK